MNRSYHKLCGLGFRHNYYTNGYCRDFALSPCADTVVMMKRVRLKWGSLAKTQASDFSLLQEQAGGLPLVAAPSSYLLRFKMRLENPHFLNFTNLPSKKRDEIYFWENLPSSSVLDASIKIFSVAGNVYAWSGLTLGTPDATGTVTATHLASGKAFTAPSFTENGVRIARIKMEGLPVGIYELTEDGGAITKKIYNDPEVFGQDVFGVLHLNCDASLAPSYTLSFSAKSTPWVYYLILAQGTLAHSNFIYEIHHVPPVGPALVTILPVTSPNAEELAKVASLIQMNPGTAVLVHKTSSSLPYQEAARSYIKLGRRPSTGLTAPTYLINHLPNPVVGQAVADVVVSVDPPNP